MFESTEKTVPIQLMASTLSSIGDGVIVTDQHQTVLYMNTSAAKLTGWAEKEAEGKPFCEIFPLVSFFTGVCLESPITAVLKHGRTMGLQNLSALVDKNGKKRFISASCSPICSGENIKGVVVVFRDIDRIKHMEEEIKREKENLKHVLEALPTGILLIGEDATVKWANKPFLDLFYIEKENIEGRYFGNGIHCIYSREKGCGEGEKCCFCEMRKNIVSALGDQISRKNILFRCEFLNQGEQDGYWLKINCIPINVAGEQQVVVAIEDMTEQKQHEALLQKGRDEAESANRMKSEFLANISHEIRTPLNGVIGMMDLLLQTNTNTIQTEYIQMAKISANSLLKVINDVLEFSRIEAGKISIVYQPFDLQEWVCGIIRMHTPLAEQKGLQLSCYIKQDTPEYVQGDPDRLRQILNNLLSNAIKFTDIGEIRVQVGQAEDMACEGLEICVIDTGIGISAAKMSLLFKRFSQVDGSVTRRHSGTGLGLAICKQLAELMGGAISAESEMGKGSIFRFTVPLAFCTEAAETLEKSAAWEPVKPFSSIITDAKELEGFFTESMDAAGASEAIMLLDHYHHAEDGEHCIRAGLSENGEICFHQKAEPHVEELPHAWEALQACVKNLYVVLGEDRFAQIEEMAHTVKIAAIRAGSDELADMAFKTELAARKGKWGPAKEYGQKIVHAAFAAREEKHEDIDCGG